MSEPERPPIANSAAISGSTLLIDILRRYRQEAVSLMSRLAWPCAYCGGMTREPLSMAAKRHGNSVREVIECFRALDSGGPTDEQVAAARMPTPTHKA